MPVKNNSIDKLNRSAALAHLKRLSNHMEIAVASRTSATGETQPSALHVA
jgi:hypothetical protein